MKSCPAHFEYYVQLDDSADADEVQRDTVRMSTATEVHDAAGANALNTRCFGGVSGSYGAGAAPAMAGTTVPESKAKGKAKGKATAKSKAKNDGNGDGASALQQELPRSVAQVLDEWIQKVVNDAGESSQLVLQLGLTSCASELISLIEKQSGLLQGLYTTLCSIRGRATAADLDKVGVSGAADMW